MGKHGEPDGYLFEPEYMGQLRAVNAILYADKPLSGDARRDLANVLHAILAKAIEYRPDPAPGFEGNGAAMVGPYDPQIAGIEGWRIAGDEIERIDDMLVFCPLGDGEPIFDSDEAALDFVKARAAEGSKMHIDALRGVKSTIEL